MTDARVEVMAVPEGSIIWIHNIDFPDPLDDEPGALNQLLDHIESVTGHRKFCVLSTSGEGVVEVLGEDEIVARVRAALDPPLTVRRCDECGERVLAEHVQKNGLNVVFHRHNEPCGHNATASDVPIADDPAPYGRCIECGRAINTDEESRLLGDLYVEHHGHPIRRLPALETDR